MANTGTAFRNIYKLKIMCVGRGETVKEMTLNVNTDGWTGIAKCSGGFICGGYANK